MSANGPNVASTSLLSHSDALQSVNTVGDGMRAGSDGSGDALVSATGGQSGDSPIFNTGVINQPDGQSPIGVAAGNGENIADANALLGVTGNGHHYHGRGGAPRRSHWRTPVS